MQGSLGNLGCVPSVRVRVEVQGRCDACVLDKEDMAAPMSLPWSTMCRPAIPDELEREMRGVRDGFSP